MFELLPWFVFSCVVASSNRVASPKLIVISPGRAPLNVQSATFVAFCLFSGFVQGEPGAEPRLMQFHPNFKDGALLTVVSFLLHILFFYLMLK